LWSVAGRLINFAAIPRQMAGSAALTHSGEGGNNGRLPVGRGESAYRAAARI
jgi:hypothetical protein